MADYRKMYLHLCDAVEQALEVMESCQELEEKLLRSHAILTEGMQTCEGIYVETEE